MANLTLAHRELFKRTPDEMFKTLPELLVHCKAQREQSTDRWHAPEVFGLTANGNLTAALGNDGSYSFNDWSFSQLCSLAGVNKDTVNRLTTSTAAQVLRETMPSGNKPLQFLTNESGIRSIHGTQYTRLWNEDLVKLAAETEFSPPHEAIGGGTGLYAGEQDLFMFLIDPTGWVEIGDHAFAPGFFAWNSEVGKRSLGVQTFWFQSVCGNHIVWDAVEVVEWKRKHTGNVAEGLTTIRDIVGNLVKKRDERKDGFVTAVQHAMRARLGEDSDECLKVLTQKGITKTLAKKALELAGKEGSFSIFSIVDALTRISQEAKFVGLRTEADQKASALLQLAL